MNSTSKILLSGAVAAVLVLAATWAIDVDVEGDVKLPEIEASGGEMPEVDVRTMDVDVQSREGSVDVPTGVDVQTEEKTFEYPSVEVTPPEENTRVEDNDL